MGGKWDRLWLLLGLSFFGEGVFDGDEDDGVKECARGIPAPAPAPTPATTVDEVEADSFTAIGST